ncbi:glycosyltransferase [Teichococcus wenyumeiae]|uniref:glycosyltransferase n=1 Tax=Teichococcus wenyumeiae TaxID=2478470 RepID=UPI001314EDF1|nr:glycosyltransferase [Pseudoroseomonas wenyumeiae]
MTKEGDPLCRPARARLIWAANTAEATSLLGVPSLLAGGIDAFTFRIESAAGKFAAYRALETLYGVRSSFDVALLHHDAKASTWTAEGDFRRYVMPGAAVVHTRDPRIALSCVKRNTPYILEHHDEDYQNNFENWSDLKLSSPLCLAVVAITEEIGIRLARQGVPEQKIIILDSGVNATAALRRTAAATRWRQSLLKLPYKQLVVYTGGLQAERGIHDIMTAAAELTSTLFVLSGGHKSDIAECKRVMMARGLSNIRLFGYQNHEVVCELQQAADVLIFSRAAEGRGDITSPLKMFEYLLSGTPIVAADIPATTRWAKHDIAVQFYQPAKPASIAAALKKIANSFPFKQGGYEENIRAGHPYVWQERQRRLLEFVGHVPVKLTY